MLLSKYRGIIYKYTSPSNKIYIGQTISENGRRLSHLSIAFNPKAKDYNTPFHKAIRKYGFDSFNYEVVCTAQNSNKLVLKALLNQLESLFISYYNSYGKGGYNCTKGGEGNVGLVHSKQTLIKMSNSQTGHPCSQETRAKMSRWQIGKKLSQETKDKISKAHKGKEKFDNRKPVQQFTLTGELIGEYPSIKHAALALDCNASLISKALKNPETYSAKGFKWNYKL